VELVAQLAERLLAREQPTVVVAVLQLDLPLGVQLVLVGGLVAVDPNDGVEVRRLVVVVRLLVVSPGQTISVSKEKGKG